MEDCVLGRWPINISLGVMLENVCCYPGIQNAVFEEPLRNSENYAFSFMHLHVCQCYILM